MSNGLDIDFDLAFTPDDRLAPPTTRSAGWATPLVYGLLLPFTLVTVGFAGWYMVTGETPLEVVDPLLHGSHIDQGLPPRPGAEKRPDALMRPPAAAKAPEGKPAPAPTAAPMMAPAPTPAPAPVQAAPPPAEPKVSLPEAPPPVAAPAPAPAPTSVTAASSFAAPKPLPPLAVPQTPPTGESLAPPSFARLAPPKETAKPLAPGPLPDMLRQTGYGALPIRAAGQESWKVYARPATVTKAGPKIAVVVTGLGLSQDATLAAIGKLPADVSLSFSPYGGTLDAWIKKAREGGHEALLDLPLEPANFPQHDAGPMAVLASQSPGEAVGRMTGVLGKATTYIGVAAPLRSPVAATESWSAMLQELKDRGLLILGDGLVGMEDRVMPAAAQVTEIADETPFRTAIDAHLAQALAVAQRDGSAIIYVSARPVSFERLAAFIDSLPEKGVALVPASALVRPEP